MAEIDTSSYPKPQQTNFLDTASKLQGLEAGKLGIDQAKLKLINDRYGIMLSGLRSLPPESGPNEFTKLAQHYTNLGLITPQIFSEEMRAMPTDSKQFPAYRESIINRLASNQEAINYYHGTNTFADNGQQQVPINTSQRNGIVRRDTGQQAPVLQNQIPPTAPRVLPSGAQGYVGPQAEIPAPGLPIAPPNNANAPMVPNRVQTLPIRPTAPTQPQAVAPQPGSPSAIVQNRSAPAYEPIPTSLPPGVAEARQQAGTASGTQLAQERVAATNFQREIFPLTQALPALEKLGTKGTGPGTETINQLKSFILTNIPGIKESDPGFASVPTFDKAKKYLTDFVNQTGNSGTNDKLAAAFAGNPSVGISNAAAVDVVKSAISLRMMKQALYQEFEATGKPPEEYSKWAAQQTNKIDPRAFGVHMMSDEAKQKLFKQLQKNPKEAALFKQSWTLAQKHNLTGIGQQE